LSRPDYRGSKGSYYKDHKPITHDEYCTDPHLLRRYWSRSLVGYDRFSLAEPNAGHVAAAELQKSGRLRAGDTGVSCITQNVDGLHQAAGMGGVVNLHGLGHDVRCMSCGTVSSRRAYHRRLAASNPSLFAHLSSLPESPELRPDGDADLDEIDVSELSISPCDKAGCGGLLKPDVVFFGAQVPKSTVELCYEACNSAGALLVAGSSLTVYSSFRFVRRFLEDGKKVMVVNVGETRADGMEGVEKVEANVTDVFRELAKR